jgi:pyruvate-ferredoxin/flavodoxin oxidoreductase
LVRQIITVDGNEAVASVAYRSNEVIAIYPITPAAVMGELAEEWSVQGRKNIWGAIPEVVEMQSEAGAIGTVHGALQSGALSTTFTASQGLLLMIPNLYKIAGELTSFCMHVSARTIATHALSIFGDHSDVMACRQTGMAMLCSGSAQEAHDLACIAHSATLKARVPFIHFFDGFRTSHQIDKLVELSDEDLREMLRPELVAGHRARALTPDNPVLRGSSQNPDTFFQMQEARNPYYLDCPDIVQSEMDRFGELTGRQYQLYEYCGDPEADKVIVTLGSSGETVHETVEVLNSRLNGSGGKFGVLKVHLFRPFSLRHFVDALPASVRSIAVLDRTKEHGSLGEPLYTDVVMAFAQAKAAGSRKGALDPVIIGGRYGLSSKEFTPRMVKAIFDELDEETPKSNFTVGIIDDVTRLSLTEDETFDLARTDLKSAMFYGLGSDGTVGANKNSIKIISEATGEYAQGYFVYDSKKAGSTTTSHLRFSPTPIQSAYLIQDADFVACHQWNFIGKVDVLEYAAQDATFLLNSPYGADGTWAQLPREFQQEIIDKNVRVYVIDAKRVAEEAGMGRRINTVMQTCFFAISEIMSKDEAISQIKAAIEKSYGAQGRNIVEMNFAAVDSALDHLVEMPVPSRVTSTIGILPPVPDHAPDFVRQVTGMMLAGKGDMLPVSALPVDGTWPLGTTQWEKRNLAPEIPVWIPELCIQCNKCALVCPHAAIRVKAFEPAVLVGAPPQFLSMDYKGKEFGEAAYTVQVAPEDCTGCTLCVKVCPGQDKKTGCFSLEMQPQPDLVEQERESWEFFLGLPEADRTKLRPNVKMSQFAEPLFEFSGACSGCGETPYIKLITQLYGDRSLIANATGCSSIFGGNLPTTPYTTNREGRGPAWANSLFEDNAEFGLGFRLALDKHVERAHALLDQLGPDFDADLVAELLDAPQSDEMEIFFQRGRVGALRSKLKSIDSPVARELEHFADYFVKKDVWIIGGDGWAYDIGSAGLDHVMASGANVNILVMDTEVYSNTGGQQSKATPMGASAKFVTGGKTLPKKDLGLMAISYGHVYVASVAFGASDAQLTRAIHEAASYDGPSLIIANAPCIEHGYDLGDSLGQMKLAVDSGYWLLYRYDPRLIEAGKKPLQLDSKPASIPLNDYFKNENRFAKLERGNAEHYHALVQKAQISAQQRRSVFEKLAELEFPAGPEAIEVISGGQAAAE